MLAQFEVRILIYHVEQEACDIRIELCAAAALYLRSDLILGFGR